MYNADLPHAWHMLCFFYSCNRRNMTYIRLEITNCRTPFPFRLYVRFLTKSNSDSTSYHIYSSREWYKMSRDAITTKACSKLHYLHPYLLVTLISVWLVPICIPTAWFAAIATSRILFWTFSDSIDGSFAAHFNKIRSASCQLIRDLDNVTCSVYAKSLYTDFRTIHELLNNDFSKAWVSFRIHISLIHRILFIFFQFIYPRLPELSAGFTMQGMPKSWKCAIALSKLISILYSKILRNRNAVFFSGNHAWICFVSAV